MMSSADTARDSTLDALVTVLLERGWRCACAESCTGGGVGERLTRRAGSSNWFECGVVVYSNAAKRSLLGVPDDMLTVHGAVSEPVAEAMAQGLLQRCGAQTTVAVTGIAGPDGGSRDKPVGTVVFAWAARDCKPEVVGRHFTGDRQRVRAQSVEYALSRWVEYLTRSKR